MEGLDGELIVGNPAGEGVFNATQSGVMSKGKKSDFRFYVFDYLTEDKDDLYQPIFIFKVMSRRME